MIDERLMLLLMLSSLVLLLIVLLLQLIVPLSSLSWLARARRQWHSGPSLQYLIIVQSRPYSTHHLLDLITR